MSHSIFGFLFGVTTAGASLYYYVIDEYKVSNELLMEDIYVRTFFCSSPTLSSLSNSLPSTPHYSLIASQLRI